MSAEIIKWPMSVLRLRHRDRAVLAEAAAAILIDWERYSDFSLGIHAHTGDAPHNAVTPIARRRGLEYELDFVLRNNRTDEGHKLGIFHVHDDLHHIKKENIGLIEVMGLFILPGRLASEFESLAKILCGQEPFDRMALSQAAHPLNKHLPWLETMVAEVDGKVRDFDEAMGIIKSQCGEKCVRVLDDCGVFKDNEEGLSGFLRFLETAGFTPK
jgi:UDPglucose--hexose-1-phosphate uridylyltransferase